MDFERRYDSIEEVLDVAKSAEGKLVKEYDVSNRLETKKNKGGIGQIIEDSILLTIWKSISVLLKNHRCGIRIKKSCLCFINGLMV